MKRREKEGMERIPKTARHHCATSHIHTIHVHRYHLRGGRGVEGGCLHLPTSRPTCVSGPVAVSPHHPPPGHQHRRACRDDAILLTGRQQDVEGSIEHAGVK